MNIKTYDIKDILNTKIYDLYVDNPMVTIKAFIHDIFLKLVNNYYNYDHINDLLDILFVGFAENGFIDGYISRDEDGYIVKSEYKYNDAIKLYNLLVNYIFSDKQTNCGVSRMPDDYNFEVGM